MRGLCLLGICLSLHAQSWADEGDRYFARANDFVQQGLNDSALHYFSQALSQYESQSLNEPAIDCYIEIGTLYVIKQELEQAKAYCQKGFALVADRKDLQASQLYHLQGIISYQAGDKKSAINQIQEAINILKQLPDPPLEKLARLYHNLSIWYTELGEPGKAQKYADQALQIRKKNADQTGLAVSYIGQGMAEIKKGEPDQALLEFQKALMHCRQDEAMQARVHFMIAELFESVDQLDSAQKYAQQAICDWVVGFDDQQLSALPSLDRHQLLSPGELLYSLKQKAQLLLKDYNQSKDSLQLRQSFDSYKLAVQLLDTLRLNVESNSSKLSLIAAAWPIYEGAIATAYARFQIDPDPQYIAQAFYFAEKSKAILLLEAAADDRARFLLPDSLHQAETQLRQQIATTEKKYQDELVKASLADPRLLNQLNTERLRLRQANKALIAQMEQKFPAYYRLKYDLHVASIDQVQSYLRKQNTDAIAYFWGKQHVYAFYLQADKTGMFRLEADSSLSAQINSHRQLLTQPQTHLKAVQQYSSQSHQLATALLKPLIPNAPKALTVIPDGLIGYLPFEALLTQAVDLNQYQDHTELFWREAPYLMRQTAVRYAYSATLLLQPKHQNKTAPKSLLAFAPAYSGRDSANGQLLFPLRENIPQVQSIADLTKGDIFTGEEADKQRFLKLADQYGILHFAMHGLADDRQPMNASLAFSPTQKDGQEAGLLYAYELYNLQLQARLVVLSACQTGYGRLSRGEGIMSLARAFSYAGCPTTVTSLWNADGNSSHYLMRALYEQLLKGKATDQALRNARLAYLSQATSDEAHPYHWATYIMIGDTAPIYPSRHKGGYWLLAGLMIFLPGVWFWFRKGNKED